MKQRQMVRRTSVKTTKQNPERSVVGGFVHDHPWMTLILGVVALSTVATVLGPHIVVHRDVA